MGFAIPSPKTPLKDYSLLYAPATAGIAKSKTFAELGVTGCKVVTSANGDDYADLTADVDLLDTVLPLVAQGRYIIFNRLGEAVFVGWLDRAERRANGGSQQQTLHIEGPSRYLRGLMFKQDWLYALNPALEQYELQPKSIPRVLLFREDYATGQRVNLRAQIEQVLDYAIAQGAPIHYGSLGAIPNIQPPEDEQTDASCDSILQRCLAWSPKVSCHWDYSGSAPTLQFTANEAVPHQVLAGGGRLHLPPGVGLQSTSNGGGSLVLDLASGRVENFTSSARYDFLIHKVTVNYQAEAEVASSGALDGTRGVWLTLFKEESIENNGSFAELSYCFDLRGAGDLRSGVTGLPVAPQEKPPTGLAAAIHDPFKVLTHSLAWTITNDDVEWSSTPGMAVGVQNGGDEQLIGSRSIIQQITRDLARGTMQFEAGPPRFIDLKNLMALTRFNRTRNAARNGGSNGGGYSKSGGPDGQDSGQGSRGGGGGSGSGVYYLQVITNGVVAYVNLGPGASIVSEPPSGGIPIN